MASENLLKKVEKICKDNSASEYLDGGGNIFEIVKLLDSVDKKNVSAVTTVFTAMHNLIMKIILNYPEKKLATTEACQYLLNSHLASIHSMLSIQSNVKQRRAALKLLTAVVSMGGNLPREVLNHMSLHGELLDALTRQTQPSDPESIRTCFIHFVLSFLVQGKVSDIRALLDKRGVLSSIFADLIYDKASLVHLVLTTVKKFVLELSGISKTTKLHVFSTPVVQTLVSLYNWKGPKKWTFRSFKKQKTSETEDTENVNPEEKEIAVNAVHEFLLVLLTSNQKGIIFHDRTLGTSSGNKHNPLIKSVLLSLDRPWEHEKPADLVVKILTACPDLVKSQLSYTEPFLEPRVSQNWIYVKQFIQKVIRSINIEDSLRLCSPEFTSVQLANAIANITLPSVILKNVIYPSFEHEHFIPQHEGIKLLATMLEKAEAFTTAVEKVYCDSQEFENFKNALLQYILKHLPNLGAIMKVWKHAVFPNNEGNNDCPDEIDPIPELKERISVILHLLHLYKNVCPQLLAMDIDQNLDISPLLLFSGLDNVTEVDVQDIDDMKVDVLYLLLAMDSIPCSLSEEIFVVVLSFLISKIGDENVVSKNRLKRTIKLLLNKSGMFEGCINQIDIWVDAVAHFSDAEEKFEVTNWVVKIIKRAMKRINKYVSVVDEAERNCGEEILNAPNLEDIFQGLLIKIVKTESTCSMQLRTTIPPLICSAIDGLKNDVLPVFAEYISIVLMHTLHCQVAPEALQYLIQNVEFPTKKYILGWSRGKTPSSVKKAFDSTGAMHYISKILLSDSIGWKILIKDQALCIVNNKDTQTFVLTNNEITRLFQMTIFYFVQFTQKEILSDKVDILKLVIVSLLKMAKSLENSEDDSNVLNECVNWMFTHPTILHYFEPVYKKKSSIECVFTNALLNICTSITEIDSALLSTQIVLPFRDKFVTQIMSAVRKHRNQKDKLKDQQIFVNFVNLLHINFNIGNELLMEIITLPREKFLVDDMSKLSSWSILVSELLNVCSEAKLEKDSNDVKTMNKQLVKKLFSNMARLTAASKLDFDEWYCSLYEYLQKYQQNINAIDGKCFVALITMAKNSNLAKLLSLCVSQNEKFIQVFTNFVLNDVKVLESCAKIAIKFLSSNLNHKWDQKFISALSNACQSEIIEYLNDPSSTEEPWIEDSAEAVGYLIEHTFAAEICIQICKKILTSGDKLDGIKVQRIKLIQSTFQNCASTNENAMIEFLQFLLYVSVSTLKKNSKNEEKLDYLQKVFISTINDLRSKNHDRTYEELNKNHFWPQFTRFSLKAGLKIPKNEDKATTFSLKPLIKVCDIAYKNNSSDEYAKTIFDMATSHSEFVNIILGTSEVKRDLLELLWILVQKNHSVMLSSQVPLYLAAYNATLSESDQYILMILQYYENNGIRLYEYRPYLWGNAAAEHYSIKGVKDTALFRQPTTSRVFDLLDAELVTNTIKHYPVHRTAECGLMKCCAEVYDPAFYLPVFSHLLAENNVVACHKVINCGGLAMALAACSSTCSQIRLAAYTVICRFYFHLDAMRRSKQNTLTIHFINTLRNGIVQLDVPNGNVRLNGFVSTFLARASLIFTEPANPLFLPLQAFMMAKPALVLDTIPELLQLFHSYEIEHYAHRNWILEVIRDGLKTENDMKIALKCVLFKILFGFYTSVLADTKSKTLILEILKSVSKIPKSIVLLVTGYSLIPWLIEISEDIPRSDFNLVNIIIDIVSNILDAFTALSLKDNHWRLLLNDLLTKLKAVKPQNLLYK